MVLGIEVFRNKDSIVFTLKTLKSVSKKDKQRQITRPSGKYDLMEYKPSFPTTKIELLIKLGEGTLEMSFEL